MACEVRRLCAGRLFPEQIAVAFNGERKCPRFLDELIYRRCPPMMAGLLQRWRAGLVWLQPAATLPDSRRHANGGKGTLVRIIQALVGLRTLPTANRVFE